MKIVITGSLGHISKPLALQLVQAAHQVTVISSDPAKKTAIESFGALAAIGDIEDIPFLTKAFTAADAVYCMTPPKYTEPDQIEYYKRIALAYEKAARDAGIKKLVYLSSYGADIPAGTGFVTGSYHAENILNRLEGISIIHMRPTFFYYNFLGFIPFIKKAGFIGAVYGGDDKLAVVSPADIADAIAVALTENNSGSEVRYVTSDDRTCNEIAAVIGKAIGIPDLQWKVLQSQDVLEHLVSSGMPANSAKNLVELGLAIHSGLLRKDFDNNKPVFGKIKIEDFAKEFAEQFNQSKF